MRIALSIAALALLLFLAPATAQDAEPSDDENPSWPEVDIYLPEGELDLRLNRFIRNAFFEGQLKYDFVDGDIIAFLRYRYYGYRRTYRFGFFDELEFESLESFDNDFARTRGGLLLIEQPHDFFRRSFFLIEVDRITSNEREFQFSTNKTNTFVRLGHQIGTPEDERSNAIVGEQRAEIERLFTAYRSIGPSGFGATGAVTYGFDWLEGDFDYVKIEAEVLKRFEVTDDIFLIGRGHAGTFPVKKQVREGEDLLPTDQFSIPRPEFFRLDGRQNLKGVTDRLRGTEELHVTSELFVPWFTDARRHALGLDWKTWYTILYAGVGTIGYDREVLVDPDEYIPDLGVGFEAAVELKGRRFFLSGIVAMALEHADEPEVKLSVKSYR